MIIIFPISHQLAQRRFPKVTIGLIAINILVFLGTYFIMHREFKQYQRLETELINKGLDSLLQKKETEASPFNLIFDVAELHGKSKRQAILYFKEQAEKNQEAFASWLSVYKQWKNKKEDMLVMKLGFVPAKFPSAAILFSIFVHSGWLHLLVNMWFLYLVGCSIEDVWGRFNFLLFYLGSGLAAAFMHYAVYPNSLTPCIGASGAIAGVMGAFAIRYYKEKINFFYLAWLVIRPYWGTFAAPALFMALLWLLVQLFWALMTTGTGIEASVAYWAHVGGFFFGMFVASYFKFTKLEDTLIKPRLPMAEDEPGFKSPKLLNEAMALIDEKNYNEAEEKCRRLLSLQPENGDVHLLLARLCHLQGQSKEALNEYLNLLNRALKKNDKRFATALYEEILKQFPKAEIPAASLNSLARYFKESDRPIDAVKVYEKLAADYPTSDWTPKALFFAAKICLDNLDDKVNAKYFLNKLLQDHGDFEWACFARDLQGRLQSE